MIDSGALKKTCEWVDEAVGAGARILLGGKKRGRAYEPTLITDVDRKMKVVCKEVFAPVATLQSYSTFAQAIRMVNDSVYGLQAGVFTRDMDRAFSAFENANVGGVIVNDFPDFPGRQHALWRC